MECWQLMVLTRVEAAGRVRTGAVVSLVFHRTHFACGLVKVSKGPKIQVEELWRGALIIFFFFWCVRGKENSGSEAE